MPSLSLPHNLWETVKCDFKSLFPEDVFQMWFEPVVCLETSEDAITLGVPNDFAAIWIHDNYLDLITQRLRLTAGRAVSVHLQKSDGAQRGPGPHRAAEPPAPAARSKAPAGRKVHRVDERGPAPGTLNIRNTFETFVVGANNQMAHAAALAVAEAPAQAYNPLFIYGHTGLGKTHLLHAVANFVTDHGGGLTCRYVTSETFMNDFINSLRDKRIEGFKTRYRTYDVLLIDDVQFFEHKERIQEEFFHTFNSLHEAGRQVIMSSDRPPRDIATLEDRLRSRFEWGLITDIQPPDLETRIAILRRKVKYDGIDVGDPEVLTHIASRVTTN